MTRQDKRRIDYRVIRMTKTYSITEIADLLLRDTRTVEVWIDQGLPTIDDKQPTLIFGYELRRWLHEKWDSRRVKCGFGELYCFGCATGQTAAEGSLAVVPRPDGSFRAEALCSACNGRCFRSLAVADAPIWSRTFLGVEIEVGGFNETDIRSTEESEFEEISGLAVEADFSNSDEVVGAPELPRRKRQTEEPILPANPRNERDKLGYFDFLYNCKGRDRLSIRKDEIALLKYEKFDKFANFATFTREKAKAFKSRLLEGNLSSATVLRTLKSLQEFLIWLSTQAGNSRSIKSADIAYLNLPPRERRRSRKAYSRAVPELDVITVTLRSMPGDTDLQKRNRALVAFCALTAIRETALIGLKLRHFDRSRLLIHQDPRDVRTKFGKEIHTFLVPLEPEHLKIFLDWVDYLRDVLGFLPDDPIFPRAAPLGGGAAFGELVLTKSHYSDAQMLRRAFRAAFRTAGHPCYTPHSFRHMQMVEAYKRRFSVEGIKAISQNLGHENTATTFASYGKLQLAQQEKVLADATNDNSTEVKIQKVRDFIATMLMHDS